MNSLALEHKLFHYGMWWRVFYGVLRTILGFIALKLIDVPFIDVFRNLMKYELDEEPTNMLLESIYSFLQIHPITITKFIAVYLIFWGLLDIILSIALLKHKLWAFPASLYLIGFFVLYEIYRYAHTHSPMLLAVIVVDIFIFWLIWEEYIHSKNKTTRHIPVT